MPPPNPMQRFGGAPNNLASHYQQQYPTHSQTHTPGLPPPSLGSNPGFMNANSMSNPFAGSGYGTLNVNIDGSGLGMPGGTGLASQAAQLSFASGGIHQQQQNGMAEMQRGTNKHRIRDVWAGNLAEEMGILRHLVDRYPYVAMDTEFPGVVARPMGNFTGKADYHYQTMRCNADLLKIIQLGITIFSDDGDSPPASISAADLGIDSSQPEFRSLVGKFNGGTIQLPLTWQFNFKFSLKEDMYNEVAIESLKQAGVDFQRLEVEGIDPFEFGALLMSSGLVCDEDVHWISFHSAYDFGYLTKLLLHAPLPDIENDFDRFMKKFFPSIYDIKYLLKHAIRQHQTNQLTPMDESTREILVKFEQKSGLDNLAESLKIKRQGLAHQAGSDALLTGKVFFRLRERLFNGEISDDHQSNLWGLTFPEQSTPQSNIHSTPQHYNHQLQENVSPGQNGYSNGAPSTPNTGNAGLASTPGHHNNGVAMGPLTPGGAGGVFGAFQYNSK